MIIFRKRGGSAQPACPGRPGWMSELLRNRGVRTEEEAEAFLHPALEQLHDPLLMRDMDKALELIRDAIAGGKNICVYGDYDVDGIGAAAILTETLREEAVRQLRTEARDPGGEAPERTAKKRIRYRIPNRHTEGYGLNRKAVEELSEKTDLLITVDCGISNAEEVRLAQSHGMKVIVTDHHQLPEKLPEADAVLNPLLGDYPYRSLCGAGVALKICQALQGLDGVLKRIEIAALSTVADVVPLTGENRVIVQQGMLRMSGTERPGLAELMKLAEAGYKKGPEGGRIPRPVTSRDLAFRLGPRLNAAGRLEDAAQGVVLLMTRDPKEAAEIARHLDENNQARRTLESRTVAEAEIRMKRHTDLRRDRAVVVCGEGWNPGVIGLAAGRLCEKYHHPTVVLTLRDGEAPEEKDEGAAGETESASLPDRDAVGSCRSIPGIHLFECLKECDRRYAAAHAGDLLFRRYGGHAQAAGLTIPASRIDAFRTLLNEVIRETCDDRCFIPVVEYDAEVRLTEITYEMVDALAQLEPTGCGNPAPALLVRDARVLEARTVGRDGAHLKLSLMDDGVVLDGIGFGLGPETKWNPRRVDAVFTPERNEYMGRSRLQLALQAIRPAERENGEEDSVLFLRCLQEMSASVSKKTEYGVAETPLPPETLLKERLDPLDLSVEELRAAYVGLRKLCGEAGELSAEKAAERLGLSRDQLLTVLTVFEERELLTWRPDPFQIRPEPRPRKCDITQSPLLIYIREHRLGAGRE